MSEEIDHLQAENKRLPNIIAACRIKFGDCAVNQAIHENMPRESVKSEFPTHYTAKDWQIISEFFSSRKRTKGAK